MDLGKRFKRFRNARGLTQREAAELIGVNAYQLGNYETNRSEPSISILKKMSEVYCVSLDRLLLNNWMKKKPEVNLNDEECIDLDDLLAKLTTLVDEINKASKK